MNNIHEFKHDHVFGQDQKRAGEKKTLMVVIITAIMMVLEIAFGIISGSMALLADGLHMASHTAALGINVFAYAYARRHADDKRFSFGTGKINALGGFTGAILLAVFSFIMAVESVKRFIFPVDIVFDQAIVVAVVGLVVNGLGVIILQGGDHSHEHHSHEHHSHGAHHHHDHNLKSAYLHVLADALTSVFAIFALIVAKYWGFTWADPLMGIVGSILVLRWSWGLLGSSSKVLLDQEGPSELREAIKEVIESDGQSHVCDLHLWSIGPNVYSVIISVFSQNKTDAMEYKNRLPSELGLSHITIEVLSKPNST